MKTATVLFFALFFSTAHTQTDDFQLFLDSAKVLFNSEKSLTQEELDKFDYFKIVSLLEKAIQLNPEDTEAKYFLGYTYSRINSRDGRGMIDMNLDLVQKSSKLLEEVNKLSPKYTGDIIMLDPYSKLSSEWGSMAMCYWHNNNADSAIWAFNEGKKRGGFNNFTLEINKKVLDACAPNAILVSFGDNSTIPLWYLQIAEGYRTDVSVVDASLLNSTWYPSYLSHKKIVAFDVPDVVLDTLQYTEWAESTIDISGFSWSLKPSYYDTYLLRGDRVLLSLLKQNKFQREMYFTTGFPEEYKLSLSSYLHSFVVVDKLSIDQKNAQSGKDFEKEVTEVLQLSQKLNTNSPDELQFFDYFRYTLLKKANDYLIEDKPKKARELVALLDKYADEKHLPYQHERTKKYADKVRRGL